MCFSVLSSTYNIIIKTAHRCNKVGDGIQKGLCGLPLRIRLTHREWWIHCWSNFRCTKLFLIFRSSSRTFHSTIQMIVNSLLQHVKNLCVLLHFCSNWALEMKSQEAMLSLLSVCMRKAYADVLCWNSRTKNIRRMVVYTITIIYRLAIIMRL